MSDSLVVLRGTRVQLIVHRRSGRLLALTNLITGTELLAPLHEPGLPQGLDYLLTLAARLPDGRFVTALPPPEAAAVRQPGARTVEVVYDRLDTSDGPLPVHATISARIVSHGEDEEIVWSLALRNESDAAVHEVLFPRVVGVSLGLASDPATADLIYPYHAGERTRNPASEYAGPEFLVDARNGVSLQDTPRVGGHPPAPVYARECNYLGSASMQWLDYYDHTEGLYCASHDPTALVTGVRVETGGPAAPWLGFAFRKHVGVRPGHSWRSESYVTAPHCGDWHWGADRYRAWATSVMRFLEPPRWFRDDPVMNMHYDFKSQSGRVTHRFADIPQVHARARRHGMEHLLFAGWNRLGFDGAYAEYFPDLELGTQVELREAIRAVVGEGGKVTLYINCRIFNTRSDYLSGIVESAACRDRDGRLYEEAYGTERFAVMCPDSSLWRRLTADFAYWFVDVYGATGVYLDQVGSAPAVPCFAMGHEHAPDEPGTFNQGYLKLLQDVHARVKGAQPDAFLMIENCGDVYGQYVDAHLTWMPSADAGKRDRYWAVFKYTFPECAQVNMLPRAWSEEAELDRNRSMLTGSGLWVRAEEDILPEVAETIHFRRAINDAVTHGVFRDTVGLRCGAGVEATRFDRREGDRQSMLVVAWNRSDRDGVVEVELEDSGKSALGARRLVMGRAAEGWQELGALAVRNGWGHVRVPPGELWALALRLGQDAL